MLRPLLVCSALAVLISGLSAPGVHAENRRLSTTDAVAAAASSNGIQLPDFDLVTNLEHAPRPTREKPARRGRVFDGPVTQSAARAAWRGGSLVAVYDYGINCHTKTEPMCDALGVETIPDVSGFDEERTVADPKQPKFLESLGRRLAAQIDALAPRRGDLLALHIDNLGLLSDVDTTRAIYATARPVFEKRRLPPLFVLKNAMRIHESLLADASLKPAEAAYLVCENCLTKAGGAEFEAGLRIAKHHNKPLVLIEFGKAKKSWQDTTVEQVQDLAARLKQNGVRGLSLWGPDEDRYEFTQAFSGATDAEARNAASPPR